MKIVRIFDNRLFAFQWDEEETNELDRLLTCWNEVSYLYQFVQKHSEDIPRGITVELCVNQLLFNSQELEQILNEIAEDTNRSCSDFFKPLNNLEYGTTELSRQKGRRNFLGLYAIRIDNNCFVITGGAIKLHHLNKDRPHTAKEMQKMEKCRDYLKYMGIADTDSFYELINE